MAHTFSFSGRLLPGIFPQFEQVQLISSLINTTRFLCICKQSETLYSNVVIRSTSLSVMAISWLSGGCSVPELHVLWVLSPVVTGLGFLSTKLLPYI